MTIPTEYYKVIRREPGLVCYWRMNDNIGTRALDWAGKYNLNGIYDGLPENGVSLISADSAAGSKKFGGENKNIEIPNAEPLQVIGEITIEFWILPLTTNQTCCIFSKMNGAFTFPNPYRVGLEEGKLIFALGNGESKTSIIAPSVLQVSVPSHVVANSFRKKMRIFIDGSEVVSGNYVSQEVKDGGKPVFVGELGNNTSRFNGMISELSLYSSAISLPVIKEHFAVGRQIIYEKPYYNTFDRPSYS